MIFTEGAGGSENVVRFFFEPVSSRHLDVAGSKEEERKFRFVFYESVVLMGRSLSVSGSTSARTWQELMFMMFVASVIAFSSLSS